MLTYLHKQLLTDVLRCYGRHTRPEDDLCPRTGVKVVYDETVATRGGSACIAWSSFTLCCVIDDGCAEVVDGNTWLAPSMYVVEPSFVSDLQIRRHGEALIGDGQGLGGSSDESKVELHESDEGRAFSEGHAWQEDGGTAGVELQANGAYSKRRGLGGTKGQSKSE